MSYANLTGTTIRRAAVRGARLDGIAARRSTERLLERIPDSVPGMGASAVLCVRRMSVHVRNRQRYMQQGSRVLGEGVERLVRHAARPALGAVPANAEAVLFADRAELLSCVARDFMQHQLAQVWWWRVLLPGSGLTSAAMQLWVSEAAHAPTALARLADLQDAVAFVRTLDDANAVELTQAIVRTHGLALLTEDSTVTSPLSTRSQSDSPLISKSLHDDVYVSPHNHKQEIRTALPEAWAPNLTNSQRRLLAVGLSLVRLPRLVRTAAYAEALSALLAQLNETSRRSHHSARAEPEITTSHSTWLSKNDSQVAGYLPEGERAIIPSPASGRGLGRGLPESGILNKLDTGLRRCDELSELPNNGGASLPVATPEKLLPAVAHDNAMLKLQASPTAAKPNLPALQALLRGRENSVAPAKAGAQARSGLLDSRLRGNDGTLKSELMIAQRAPSQVATIVDSTRVVDTQYGGVFFLCNAALALDLYADFTRPLDRGLELTLWDFLALAAMDLGGPAVRQDPLWPLLGELAGRAPGQRPGSDFTPPNEWRMPMDWLLPFAEDTDDWTWETDAARLVVRHPAGFVVLDLLRGGMPVEEQLRIELARYGVLGIRSNNPLGRHTGAGRYPAIKNKLRSSQNLDVVPLAWGISNHLDTGLRRYDAVSINRLSGIKQASSSRRGQVTPLARWRSWVMSYLGRRVARALGDVHWRRACRMLLCLPGRIELDAERLNVHFSLERLPVVVRMAGLDRDPGWIPAAGRDVRFHFGCDHA